MSLSLSLSCPCCKNEVAEFNVTHNLTQMASKAGCYWPLWRTDVVGITKASELIWPLRCAVAVTKAYPDDFRELNPENGWGDYDGFLRALEYLLEKCEQYPEAEVSAWA